MKTKKILVFCGSQLSVESAFEESMTKLVQFFQKNQYELIFGGSNMGLMSVLCEGCFKSKVKITGVITQNLFERDIAFKNCDELLVTQNLHERKKVMMDEADAIICFPGGLGTIDELLSAMATNSLKETSLPIIVLNIKEYFNPLISYFENMCHLGFMKEKNLKALNVLDSVEELSGRKEELFD